MQNESPAQSPAQHETREAAGIRTNASPVAAEPAQIASNPGTNLFVRGISQSLTEKGVKEMFSKFGTVEKVQIMYDPHLQESRGFGFVSFVESESADAAIAELSGTMVSGRTLNVELAKRGRPRTPTPGQYHGIARELPDRRERESDRPRERERDQRSSLGKGFQGDRYEPVYEPRRDARDFFVSRDRHDAPRQRDMSPKRMERPREYEREYRRVENPPFEQDYRREERRDEPRREDVRREDVRREEPRREEVRREEPRREEPRSEEMNGQRDERREERPAPRAYQREDRREREPESYRRSPPRY